MPHPPRRTRFSVRALRDDDADSAVSFPPRRRHLWSGDGGAGYTNDSSDGSLPREQGGVDIEIRDKFPIRYGCEHRQRAAVPSNAEQQQEDQLQDTIVEFDYELTMQYPNDFRENLQHVEWTLLESVVSKMKLKKCELVQQIEQGLWEDKNNAFGETARTTEQQQDETPKLLVAVSSDAVDWIDAATLECPILGLEEEGVRCLPMRGIMTVTTTSNIRKDEIRRVLFDQLAEAMNSHSSVVADIAKLRFVGERRKEGDEQEKMNGVATATTTSSTQGVEDSRLVNSSNLGIGLAALIGFLIIAILGLLIRHRRSGSKDGTVRRECESGNLDDGTVVYDGFHGTATPGARIDDEESLPSSDPNVSPNAIKRSPSRTRRRQANHRGRERVAMAPSDGIATIPEGEETGEDFEMDPPPELTTATAPRIPSPPLSPPPSDDGDDDDVSSPPVSPSSKRRLAYLWI